METIEKYYCQHRVVIVLFVVHADIILCALLKICFGKRSTVSPRYQPFKYLLIYQIFMFYTLKGSYVI